MKTFNVDIQTIENKNYPIHIGENLKQNIIEFLNDMPTKKAVVVTNETIFELYENYLQAFNETNLKIEFCILPDGEIYKTQASLDRILTCAFEAKLERNDLFIAFGGGVIGDITGFAAAIYLRGINFLQVPTTLLAQVDSSVGGKVAINTAYGKNLLGAFYQPKAVFSDLNFLKTLPKREILTGFSEIVKYSFIEKTCAIAFSDFAKFLFENSLDNLKTNLNIVAQTVYRCCELKAAVVNQDEKEMGLRAILNFGHTIGHAVEKTTNYALFTHGEAVAIGMRAAFLLALKLNKISVEYFDFAQKLLKSYDLDFKLPKDIPAEKILEALIYDKKVKNGQVRFVLPVDYATVEICSNIDETIVLAVIKELY